MFVIGQVDKNAKLIKKCSNFEANELDLSTCEDFTNSEVKHFFYKEGNYVLIDDKNTLKMCNYYNDHCDQGKLKDSWPIKNLLLEGQLLILVIENKELDKHIIFQYNFLKMWFNWFNVKFESFHHLRLFKGE